MTYTPTFIDLPPEELPPHVRTVSADTAQLRHDLEALREHHAKGVSTDTVLHLMGRLLGIVERLEDRMLRR